MTSFPYEVESDPKAVDIDADKLNKIIRKFERQQLSGRFPGGQLVLRRYGKMVVNKAFGLARGYRPDETHAPIKVSPNTPFPVFSAGKVVAAIAIAILEERGLLDISLPISTVIPELAENHANTTTLDLLTHRAGILIPDLHVNYKKSLVPGYAFNKIAYSKPKYKLGTFAYMPWESGWIFQKLFKNLDGRSLSDFVIEEISGRLNCPALKYGLSGRDPESIAYSYWLGKEKEIVVETNIAKDFEKITNLPAYFDTQNPSYTMITDAASLAAFYECLLNKGTTVSGHKIVSEDTIKRYTTKRIGGWNKSLKNMIAFGQGFAVGTKIPSLFGWWNSQRCFGHGGILSTAAFGDYETGISAAIVTNGNKSVLDAGMRLVPITHGLRRACK